MSGFEDKQREQNENEYVEEMGEDEYDALPEEEKQRIDLKRLQRKKDRILRYENLIILFLFSFVYFLHQRTTKQRRKSSIRTRTFTIERS